MYIRTNKISSKQLLIALRAKKTVVQGRRKGFHRRGGGGGHKIISLLFGNPIHQRKDMICANIFVSLVVTVPFVASSPMPSFVSTDMA